MAITEGEAGTEAFVSAAEAVPASAIDLVRAPLRRGKRERGDQTQVEGVPSAEAVRPSAVDPVRPSPLDRVPPPTRRGAVQPPSRRGKRAVASTGRLAPGAWAWKDFDVGGEMQPF